MARDPRKLTDIQKGKVYKSLATKKQYDVGVDFDFDKYIKGNLKIINAVNKIYREVRENPEKYAVTDEVSKIVQKAMADRMGTRNKAISKADLDKDLDIKRLVTGTRNKAWALLDKKLEMLYGTKELKEQSIGTIAKVAGIAFDKGQIVEGRATENIAVHAKVKEDMSSEDLMKEIMRIRDNQQKQNDK